MSGPIHDGHRQGIAAIGINALKERVNRAKLKQLTKLVTNVAGRVSAKLGYRAPAR